ncbi:response regulator [Arcticibacter sp. MXS-1]|uniref:response regulator n=1 Tax=Arcticibacter sp. MXS-1 TaxID=3341726 RepID=UPI0035A9437D
MPKQILIIDDEPRNIFALVAVLKARKYGCITASSAEEGLAILRDRQDIGIILMDMMMPEMDGYETIGKIKEDKKLPDIPIIAVTAQAMVGDKEKCLSAGADDYIAKPINVEALVALLNQYLQ